MDKKQFLESFITTLPDASGQQIQAFEKIREIFHSLKSELMDTRLRAEFEVLETDILFRVWMLEQVCNSKGVTQGDGTVWGSGPLIIISLSRDILFTNQLYCKLSGLKISEIQDRAKDGILYDGVYEWASLIDAKESAARLRAGKGYKQLELIMRHSGKTISWNSHGWVGGSLWMNSGRIITEENDQIKQRQEHYRWSLMNTARLMDNLYQICVHGILSRENEAKLIWIQEFLSMFDFLWNHSEFFMEVIYMPETPKGKISGFYNTVYAQFFRQSFKEDRSFKNVLKTSYGMSISKIAEMRTSTRALTVQELPFHASNGRYRADVYWQSSIYPHVVSVGYTNIFSFGTLVRTIRRKNIFIRIFQSIFRKASTQA